MLTCATAWAIVPYFVFSGNRIAHAVVYDVMGKPIYDVMSVMK